VNAENSRRFAWQLGLLIMFWGASNFTMIVQYNHLPPTPLDIVEAMRLELFKPDPWTFHPWEYNPFNDRMTLVEALVIWLGLMYGLFRLINIVRIVHDDEREEQWSDFWAVCERT